MNEETILKFDRPPVSRLFSCAATFGSLALVFVYLSQSADDIDVLAFSALILLFLGTLAEGESLLVLGSYFAHRGYLELGGVMLTAFVGAVCGDQLFFHLGRACPRRWPAERA